MNSIYKLRQKAINFIRKLIGDDELIKQLNSEIRLREMMLERLFKKTKKFNNTSNKLNSFIAYCESIRGKTVTAYYEDKEVKGILIGCGVTSNEIFFSLNSGRKTSINCYIELKVQNCVNIIVYTKDVSRIVVGKNNNL